MTATKPKRVPHEDGRTIEQFEAEVFADVADIRASNRAYKAEWSRMAEAAGHPHWINRSALGNLMEAHRRTMERLTDRRTDAPSPSADPLVREARNAAKRQRKAADRVVSTDPERLIEVQKEARRKPVQIEGAPEGTERVVVNRTTGATILLVNVKGDGPDRCQGCREPIRRTKAEGWTHVDEPCGEEPVPVARYRVACRTHETSVDAADKAWGNRYVSGPWGFCDGCKEAAPGAVFKPPT